MTHDRIPGDELVLTHEVLARRLAVRRAGVSETARALEDRGIIRYRRGRMTVRGRGPLEAASCGCCATVRDHQERFLARSANQHGVGRDGARRASAVYRAAVYPSSVAPALDTARLSLRGHTRDDFAECAAMWADPLVTRHVGGRPMAGEEVWARVLRYAGLWTLLGFG